MSTDTQHLVYHRSRVSDLEHELALARASATYWRERYIDVTKRAVYLPELSDAIQKAKYWFKQAARTPIDECYGQEN